MITLLGDDMTWCEFGSLLSDSPLFMQSYHICYVSLARTWYSFRLARFSNPCLNPLTTGTWYVNIHLTCKRTWSRGLLCLHYSRYTAVKRCVPFTGCGLYCRRLLSRCKEHHRGNKEVRPLLQRFLDKNTATLCINVDRKHSTDVSKSTSGLPHMTSEGERRYKKGVCALTNRNEQRCIMLECSRLGDLSVNTGRGWKYWDFSYWGPYIKDVRTGRGGGG